MVRVRLECWQLEWNCQNLIFSIINLIRILYSNRHLCCVSYFTHSIQAPQSVRFRWKTIILHLKKLKSNVDYYWSNKSTLVKALAVDRMVKLFAFCVRSFGLKSGKGPEFKVYWREWFGTHLKNTHMHLSLETHKLVKEVNNSITLILYSKKKKHLHLTMLHLEYQTEQEYEERKRLN